MCQTGSVHILSAGLKLYSSTIFKHSALTSVSSYEYVVSSLSTGMAVSWEFDLFVTWVQQKYNLYLVHNAILLLFSLNKEDFPISGKERSSRSSRYVFNNLGMIESLSEVDKL